VRFGVDATMWTNPRGFGRFTRNAVGRLVELGEAEEYVLVVDEAAETGFPEAARRRPVRLRRPRSGLVTSDAARAPGDLWRLSRAVRRGELDAFLFPTVDTLFPVRGVPTVVGVFDVLLDELTGEMFATRRARAFWRAKQGWALRRARRLFTLSKAAREAFVERFGLARERFHVVPAAPDPVFFPRTGASLAAGLTEAGLAEGDPFLLYAGGIGAHKNLETLLDACARLGGRAPELVVTGPFAHAAYRDVNAALLARMAEPPLRDRVRLTGYVSDEALASLYGAATAVVVPSRGEGFGLPAVEAAACAATLVLSDIPPHREFVAGGALYFPARDAAALTEALEHVLGDERERAALSDRARAAVARLSWDRTARALRDLLADAAGG
jgi:glycosyltransferase involved in cell wall biosynthesis